MPKTLTSVECAIWFCMKCSQSGAIALDVDPTPSKIPDVMKFAEITHRRVSPHCRTDLTGALRVVDPEVIVTRIAGLLAGQETR